MGFLVMFRYLISLIVTPVATLVLVFVLAQAHYLFSNGNVWDYIAFGDPRFQIALAVGTFLILALTTPIALLFRNRLGQRLIHYLAYGAAIGVLLSVAFFVGYGPGLAGMSDILVSFLMLAVIGAGVAGIFWALCIWRNEWWHRHSSI